MLNYLIIGGTGSLGNALVEQLLKKDDRSKICIYSRDEHKQEQMAQKFKDERLRFFIGDIRDKDRLRLAINSDVTHIINAAALKIVPAMEYNPGECIKTNILGVQNVVDCLLELKRFPIEGRIKFIQISTDKAVRPINIYGAAKLCAEKLTIAANNIQGINGHAFSVVRYGNVANSNGSVIPLFKKQLANNEPLTITDERMTRFWITLEDAATFVLECLGKMEGGETFIPKMASFKVTDLAMAMSDKPYIVTGIRPGEKIHEAISEGLTSDTNNNWYDVAQLQAGLVQLGVI